MSSNRYKVLVIEDEPKIRSFVKTVLETNDYKMIPADTYAMGTTMFMSHTPDIVILDLGLPDADGIDFISFVRKTSAVPIIVLSARTGEQDKVSALDMGANDYITKPFGTAELLARIRAALRNSRFGKLPEAALIGKFVLHDMTIDYDKRTVYIKGVDANLTQTEYNIISLLSEHTGKVLTYTSIIKAVWGYPDTGSTKKLQVNMANIRKKLGIKPGDNKYIINELGVGYRMCDQNE
ncbi:MAG: response regulator transcription factor [Ruminococcus sp.]|nr:response regulator transcription factor [Ruminococcus sp.]MBR6599076.1 response regulator transcription factor [Oscillospiraceae bacterium]